MAKPNKNLASVFVNPTFEGSYFDVGRQQGIIYKKNGVKFPHITSEVFNNQLDIYKKKYPEMLEELEGIAKGGDFNKKDVINTFIFGELLWAIAKDNLEKGCTIFGLKNENGFFVGRNFDWLPHAEKVFQVYKVINPNINSFISITDMGVGRTFDEKRLFYIVEDAINDKGLFIGIASAYHQNWSYGLSRFHMNKLITEKCTTLDEALAIFDDVPLCCPCNFFIADQKGDMAVVEHTYGKRFKVLSPEDNLLIKTNHYLDPEFAKEDTFLKYDMVSNTLDRYNETQKRVNSIKDSFNLSDITKILRDNKSCVYQDSDIKTIWSLAFDMKNKEYKLYWDLLGERRSRDLVFR